MKRAIIRSSRWRSFGFGIIAALCVLYLILGDLGIYINNNRLENAFTELSTDSVTWGRESALTNK